MVRNEEYYMEQLNKFDKALSMPNKRWIDFVEVILLLLYTDHIPGMDIYALDLDEDEYESLKKFIFTYYKKFWKETTFVMNKHISWDDLIFDYSDRLVRKGYKKEIKIGGTTQISINEKGVALLNELSLLAQWNVLQRFETILREFPSLLALLIAIVWSVVSLLIAIIWSTPKIYLYPIF